MPEQLRCEGHVVNTIFSMVSHGFSKLDFASQNGLVRVLYIDMFVKSPWRRYTHLYTGSGILHACCVVYIYIYI